jgi:uncharacterized protein (DUF2132 family)
MPIFPGWKAWNSSRSENSGPIRGDKQHMNLKSNDPLHGLTLETILTRLVEKHGWKELSQRIPIRCFYNEPSIKSSLKFLRRTPWARKQVEDLYLELLA